MKTLAIFASVAAAQISAEDLLALLNDNELTTLAKAVSEQEALVEALTTDEDGFTVFAPPNDVLGPAVEAVDPKAIPDILSYHTSSDVFSPSEDGTFVIETGLQSEGLSGAQVLIATVEGDDVTITHGKGTAKVTNTVTADPSIVHVIDSVLIPPEAPSKVADANGLSSLVSALTDAKLVDTVDDAQDITIFAPTNDAFAKIADTEGANFTDILTYHVVTGVAYSPNLEGTQTFPTLQGATVEVQVADGGVTVNGAKVVVADVLTSNGVVHVIDTVLSPEDGGEPDEDTEDGGATPAPAGKAVLSVSVILSMLASLF